MSTPPATTGEPGLYLGLISGTSRDGLDLALTRLGPDAPRPLHARCIPYPDRLRRSLDGIIARGRRPRPGETDDLDHALGVFFARACQELLAETGHEPGAIRAIGSHGQTVWHEPEGPDPISLQLGDPRVLAAETGITVVADFRTADLRAGGQGAPLAPLLHRELFADLAPCAVLNLGGIANLTLLGEDRTVRGFDTGPANCLMDAWCLRHRGEPYDADGAWAASGRVLPDLALRLRSEPWFSAPPPKSTGLEHFNLAWLESRLEGTEAPRDVQATLLALTVDTVIDALRSTGPDTGTLLLCGGGVHNDALVTRLRDSLEGVAVESTATRGVDPDWVEATLFAWLARARLAGQRFHTKDITGASGAVMLGDVYEPRAKEAAS